MAFLSKKNTNATAPEEDNSIPSGPSSPLFKGRLSAGLAQKVFGSEKGAEQGDPVEPKRDASEKDADEDENSQSQGASSWGLSSEDADRDRSQLANHPYWTLPWLRHKNYANDELGAEIVQVSKGELISFLNVYLWFIEAGKTIPFTLSMWLVFVFLILVHGDVHKTYQVRKGVADAVSSIIAHPLLGNVDSSPSRSDAVQEMFAKCNCFPRKYTNVVALNEEPCVDSATGISQEIWKTVPVYTKSGILSSESFSFLSTQDLRKQLFDEQLKSQNSEEDMSVINTRLKAWDQVISVSDTWFWLQHGLLPLLWQEDNLIFSDIDIRPVLELGQPIAQDASERPGRLRRTNQLIGGLRLQERRFKPEKCPVNEPLHDFYGQECKSEYPQTHAFGPGTQMQVEFQPVAGKSGIFESYFDIGRPLTQAGGALETVNNLKANDWIDSTTEWVEFQAAFFNAEVRLFLYLQVRFTFEEGGFMNKEITVQAISANLYPTAAHALPDVVWMVMIAVLFRQEVFEVLKAREKKYLGAYFRDPWNAMDWATILLGAVIFAIWLDMVQIQSDLADRVAKLPETPDQFIVSQTSGGADDTFQQSLPSKTIDAYHKEWGSIMDAIADAANKQWIQYNLLFWYTVILMLRFFKSFQGQPRLAQLSNSLLACMYDIVHYLMIFFVVFLNFAFGGHALFGSLLADWSTPSKSINSAFLALLGEFNYAEMYELLPLTATLWFWTFMILNVFILLNLLIAIIFDHYLVAKDDVGETKGVGTQVWDFLGELNWSLDWYFQRKRYLQQGILNAHTEKLFSTKGVEDLYNDFMAEGEAGITYGRTTILAARKETRLALRDSLEKPKEPEVSAKERRRASRQSSQSVPGLEKSQPSNEVPGVASISVPQGSTASPTKSKGMGAASINALSQWHMSSGDEKILAEMVSKSAKAASMSAATRERIRQKIDCHDLEQQYNMEPRFARHLLLKCRTHTESEIDYRETRNNEMKLLVTACDAELKKVDASCVKMENKLMNQYKRIVDDANSSAEAIGLLLNEVIDLFPRVGMAAPRRQVAMEEIPRFKSAGGMLALTN